MAIFTETQIEQIWQKASIVNGYDSSVWRKDFAGAWIKREYYGIQGQYGWVIDHLKPVVLGGTDEIDNLNPLQWQNNRSKSDNYPNFQTIITSEKNINIENTQEWRIR
jgi:hypothetical protein